MKLNRFIISTNGEKITEVPSMREVARYIGCTYQHMYERLRETKTNTFKYKKVEYTITDKLEAMQ